MLVRHNGVWVLLLHYTARCCVCVMMLELCLKTTGHISGATTTLSIHPNIPKSKGRLERLENLRLS